MIDLDAMDEQLELFRRKALGNVPETARSVQPAEGTSWSVEGGSPDRGTRTEAAARRHRPPARTVPSDDRPSLAERLRAAQPASSPQPAPSPDEERSATVPVRAAPPAGDDLDGMRRLVADLRRLGPYPTDRRSGPVQSAPASAPASGPAPSFSAPTEVAPPETDREWVRRFEDADSGADLTEAEIAELLEHCREQAYCHDDLQWRAALTVLLARLGRSEEARRELHLTEARSRDAIHPPRGWIDVPASLARASTLLAGARPAQTPEPAPVRADERAVARLRARAAAGRTAAERHSAKPAVSEAPDMARQPSRREARRSGWSSWEEAS